MFSSGVFVGLYREYSGLAAASTDVRALSVVVIPACERAREARV